MHGPKGVILNKLSFVVAALACGITSFAHADTTYNAGFVLQDGRLPFLRTGSPSFDGPHSLNGAWVGYGNIDATANSRDLLSSTVNPVTGALEHTWGPSNHSDNMHRAGGPPIFMGESNAYIYGPNDWTHTNATAYVGWSSLGASVGLTDRLADANTRATFTRDFSLDAHSSFTFSGFATIDIVGDANPLSAGTTYDSNGSFASLTLGDLFGRVRTTIGATIWGVGAGLSDIFSYSVGPGGLLSLTITNTGDTALLGSVNAGSYVNVSPPIPEPETWLLLLAGAGIVGYTARKRKAADTREALAA